MDNAIFYIFNEKVWKINKIAPLDNKNVSPNQYMWINAIV